MSVSTIFRNEVGHELFRISADDKKKPDFCCRCDADFQRLRQNCSLVGSEKLKFLTDPDMTPEKYDSIDFDGIESTDTMILREIMHKSLEGMPEWDEVQDWVKKHAAEQASGAATPVP